MIGYLGLTPVNLVPLQDNSGNPVFASGANASGVQLYKDNTGAIVDVNGNDQDPNTGNMYQDEIAGPYTTPPAVWMTPSPASGIPPTPAPSTSSKNWAACESTGNPGILQSIENFLANAAPSWLGGKVLTQAQIQALIAQEQACLVNAGMDSATALQVATSDINNAAAAAAGTGGGVPWYLWVGAGVIGIVLLTAAVKR